MNIDLWAPNTANSYPIASRFRSIFDARFTERVDLRRVEYSKQNLVNVRDDLGSHVSHLSVLETPIIKT